MDDKLLDTQNVVLQELLVNLRTRSQLTQKQLSSKLKRPQSYVSKYESGERKLTIIEIRSIALACNSSLDEFVQSFEEEIKLIEG